MPMAYSLEGVECGECGEEKVVWWSGDEHDDTIAVLADCRGCGREYPKKFVDKSKSHDERREIVKQRVQ